MYLLKSRHSHGLATEQVGSDGDLHANWEILDREYTDANDNNNRWDGTGIECMAVRYLLPLQCTCNALVCRISM